MGTCSLSSKLKQVIKHKLLFVFFHLSKTIVKSHPINMNVEKMHKREQAKIFVTLITILTHFLSKLGMETPTLMNNQESQFWRCNADSTNHISSSLCCNFKVQKFDIFTTIKNDYNNSVFGHRKEKVHSVTKQI